MKILGILRDKTMDDKMMHCTAPFIKVTISHSVDYNYWFKRLNTQLNKSTNQYSIKVPKVVKLTNKKTLL